MKTDVQKIVDAFDPNLEALLSPLLLYTTILYTKLDESQKYMALICSEHLCISKANAEYIQQLMSYNRFIEMFSTLGRTVIKFRKS